VNWFLRFLINAIVFYLIAKFVPGFRHDIGIWSAVIAAVIFGLVNMIIGPLLRLISLPLTLLTFGAFSFVINYILFALTVYFVKFHDPMSSTGFWLASLYGAIIMTIVSYLVHMGSESEARRSA
jgi:putative membrane protein